MAYMAIYRYACFSTMHTCIQHHILFRHLRSQAVGRQPYIQEVECSAIPIEIKIAQIVQSAKSIERPIFRVDASFCLFYIVPYSRDVTSQVNGAFIGRLKQGLKMMDSGFTFHGKPAPVVPF